MTVKQLINATTDIDTQYINDLIAKNDNIIITKKYKYIYTLLITIARKAIQENNFNIEYLFEPKHKLIIDVKNNIDINISMIQKEWHNFINDYKNNNIQFTNLYYIDS
jgi:hypothetical protein